MSIVSSVYALGTIQKDGRRFVVETHTDNLGVAYRVEYLAVSGTNYSAVMTARAAVIATQLSDTEATAVLAVSAALVLNYQTAAEFAARFWAKVQVAYQAGDKVEFGRLIWWMLERITDGSVTDAGARTTFNTAYGRSLTVAQWTTFKTSRLQPIHDRWAALQSEADL